MKIVFATSNLNKAKEISVLLPDNFEVLTLQDLELNEEIPETCPTIEGNAHQKANYITEHFGLNCFADDTGLEVVALNNEPGVKSARYAGNHRSDEDNINLLLTNLKESENKSARFKTVIALNIDGAKHEFTGIVEGEIIEQPRGNNGFGYDPIFVPENQNRTFAEMNLEEKNNFSHRARAFKKMLEFLSK